MAEQLRRAANAAEGIFHFMRQAADEAGGGLLDVDEPVVVVDALQPVEGLRLDHPVGAAVEGGAGQIDHEGAATGYLQALLAQGE